MNSVNSLGIQAVLDTFDNISELEVPDTVVINLGTIVRNNLDKMCSIDDIIENTRNECVTLNTSIYECYNRFNIKSKPYILYYIPKYDYLNNLYRRKKTTHEDRINEVLNTIYGYIGSGIDKSMLFDIPIYITCAGNETISVYKDLYNIIKELNKDILQSSIDQLRKYTLITHNPLDYYLCEYFIKINLVECYTGKIRTKQDLGYKVFKTNAIPFNQYTHFLFGDNVLVKPILSKNKRMDFIDIAAKNNWAYKTAASIYKEIQNTDVVVSELLTNAHY